MFLTFDAFDLDYYSTNLLTFVHKSTQTTEHLKVFIHNQSIYKITVK